MKLHTFDILDTTLIRKCGEPQILFHLLSYRLFPKDRKLRDIFLQWRMEDMPRNARLNEIYDESKIPSAITERYTPQQLMDTEMDEEYRNLTKNPVIASLIDQKRKEGWSIKFISDMYLESRFFIAKLKDEGIFKDYDEVIVSCEWQARKDDGTIYDKVRDKYHPEIWHHYGDNLHSDIRMARKKGVIPTLISLPFLPEEKAVSRTFGTIHYSWQSRYLAGLSRAARIKMGDTSFARMAADYVVPILLPYVTNIIRDATDRGVKTIHFLSRDGYIMHEMAKLISPNAVSVEYTFISRKALTAAFMHVCTQDEFLLLYRNPEIRCMKVEQILSKYTGIDISTLKNKFGIALENTNISDYNSWSMLVKSLFESNSLIDHIKKSTLQQYNTTFAYLDRQGVFGKDTAIADIGWLGHTRMMLNAIARSCGKEMPLFYYFSVTDNAIGSDYGAYMAYHTEIKYHITAHTPVIESYICASPHTSVSHYGMDADGCPYVVLGKNSDIDNTPIWESNLKATRLIIQSLIETKQLNNLNPSILDTWGSLSLKELTEYSHPIDYKVFAHAEGITTHTLARRLTWSDFPFLTSKSDFKFGDYAITLGYKRAKTLWKFREYVIRIIGILYQLIKSR